MSANDEKIAMTIRVPNELYWAFNERAKELGATHNGLVNVLLENWVNGTCWHVTAQRHTFEREEAARRKKT